MKGVSFGLVSRLLKNKVYDFVLVLLTHDFRVRVSFLTKKYIFKQIQIISVLYF